MQWYLWGTSEHPSIPNPFIVMKYFTKSCRIISWRSSSGVSEILNLPLVRTILSKISLFPITCVIREQVMFVRLFKGGGGMFLIPWCTGTGCVNPLSLLKPQPLHTGTGARMMPSPSRKDQAGMRPPPPTNRVGAWSMCLGMLMEGCLVGRGRCAWEC